MKLAVFTPLHPVRCGVSGYSEALLPALRQHLEIEVFAGDYEAEALPGRAGIPVRNHKDYRPEDFDAVLYHIANNPHHSYIYDMALRHPGIVVLHEFNLHHLLADVTIQRGDWDGYMREVEHNGGARALEFARRVRALDAGPDYEGVAMNRRLLETSRAVIVHSRFMVDEIRRAGFDVAVQRIPHGAWIPEANRNARRAELGVDESTPLIGIFGFLKPYKRIEECLHAMSRLVQVEPRARMILVGEEHPEYPVRRLIARRQLEPFVRLTGYVPEAELTELIAASDICLNLRYPTAGETSGTLLRALGLGRAVLVSDVGSFSELPDDICMKVPVGEAETDLITEYLNLLCTRPQIADAIGARARHYVATECSWSRVAEMYFHWIEAVAQGRAARAVEVETRPEQALLAEPAQGKQPASAEAPPAAAASDKIPAPILPAGSANRDRIANEDFLASAPPSEAETSSPRAQYILGFCHGSAERLSYTKLHLTRLVHTLELTPPGGQSDRILEMGAYMNITPALKTKLGYGEVRGSYLGPLGQRNRGRARSGDGEEFECEIDLFDAERDRYPYPDGHFSTVLCCELLEHLLSDPMHMMGELNRILAPGGHLVLTTPNICSWRAAAALLLGYHPGLFHQYILPDENGGADPRHNREYAPRDVQEMFEAAGFSVERLETGPYIATRSAEFEWIKHLMRRYKLPDHLREDVIYALGKKTGEVIERYPPCLYSGGES